MTPLLLIGLGNPLAGDDGVGCELARRLRPDPRLPPDVEVLEGGTDLLRLAPRLRGRTHVVLVDAILDPGPPGRLLLFEGELRELDDRGASVHHLPPVQALRLLRFVDPAIHDVPITFAGVTVAGARISHRISPALEDRLPALTDELVALLSARTSGRAAAGDPATA